MAWYGKYIIALERVEWGKAIGSPFLLALLDAHMPDEDAFGIAKEMGRKFGETEVVMLTSAGMLDDVATTSGTGGGAHLTKPIKESDLLNVVRMVLSPASRVPGVPPAAAVKAAPEEQPALSILLAEDNFVNQLLAIGLLGKKGHTVVVAETGTAALEAMEKQAFDLILMDVQMPEMDGLDATAAIRQKEKSSGTHIPIIAMTANTMVGDRERCLQSGMDGYLA
jgi:CheY-like chemotaxis protein